MKYLIYIVISGSLTFLGCSDNDQASPKNDKDEGSSSSGLENYTITHDGNERSYLIYTPEIYSENQKVPLLFNFHGNGDTGARHANIADFRPIADTANFILVYPQGLYGDWNISLPSDSQSKNRIDDLGFIDKMIEKISLEYNIDLTRIYAVGFSNGAGMAHALAAASSTKIAAIASMAGNLYKHTAENSSPSPTAILSIHGLLDGQRPYSNESLTGGYWMNIDNMHSYWVQKNGCNETPSTETFLSGGEVIDRIIFDQCIDGHSIEHFKVINGDHYWLNFFYNNKPTNQVIWDFLSRFDLSGALNKS